jgi:hypothetical protein
MKKLAYLLPGVHFYVYMYIQRLDKITETYRDFTHSFTNMVLDHILPSMQQKSILEWARTRSDKNLAEFCTIIFEGHLQIA